MFQVKFRIDIYKYLFANSKVDVYLSFSVAVKDHFLWVKAS